MENWIKIQRDKSGNATEDCLNDIFDNLPVIVCSYVNRDKSKLYYNLVGECLDMMHNRNDIKADTNYRYYLKIKKFSNGN